MKHLEVPGPRLFLYSVTLDRLAKWSMEDSGAPPQVTPGQTDRERTEKQRGRGAADGPNDLLLQS